MNVSYMIYYYSHDLFDKPNSGYLDQGREDEWIFLLGSRRRNSHLNLE